MSSQFFLLLGFLIIPTEGALTHEDFANHKGTIGAGDLQWMTAGRGNVRSEGLATLDQLLFKVQDNNIQNIRKVYDAFLAEIPLCYGYWKKYADHETWVGAIEKVVEVYERDLLCRKLLKFMKEQFKE